MPPVVLLPIPLPWPVQSCSWQRHNLGAWSGRASNEICCNKKDLEIRCFIFRLQMLPPSTCASSASIVKNERWKVQRLQPQPVIHGTSTRSHLQNPHGFSASQLSTSPCWPADKLETWCFRQQVWDVQACKRAEQRTKSTCFLMETSFGFSWRWGFPFFSKQEPLGTIFTTSCMQEIHSWDSYPHVLASFI